MTGYDRPFLEEKGYFARQRTATASLDGHRIAVAVDPDARLAYVEDVDPDRHRQIVSDREFLGGSVDFFWFWNADAERVAVYNRYGERGWFRYDQSVDHPPDVRADKRARLAAIDDGLAPLFDIRRTVDRCYRNLWDVRLEIARSFETPGDARISDEERLLAAQRTIDRLIFCYFLMEKDVVHAVDDAGNRFGVTPTELFDRIGDDGQFCAFLDETFFEHLASEGWTRFEVTETVAIAYPYLNDGLFRDRRIATEDGDAIRERDLDGTDCDWSNLVEELSRYDWQIETAATPERGANARKTLSPAVLGHSYESLVVSVSELSGDEDETLTLRELEEMDASASGEQLLAGNRQVGAYYTPTNIAVENTRETLWNRVRTLLTDEHDIDPDAIPHAGALFETLHDAESSLPVDPAAVESVLADLRVVDPAAGSGAFVLTAGEILAEWRSRCTDRSREDLRRDIARTSLYGVDLLDGAVEVCTLRVWLWLVGATSIDLDEGRPAVEPLPNIDCNFRQGNSLVGIGATASDAGSASRDGEWVDGETATEPDAVRAYGETIAEYRTATGERAEELRERLSAQRRALETECNRAFARKRDVRVEVDVESVQEYATVLNEATGRVKMTLDFDAPMTDDEREQLAELGFREQRNWATTAYRRDIGDAADEDVRRIFELLDGRGSISLERPVRAADIEALDPFHWPFEFPTIDAPGDDSGGPFDVVLGNPPHGSSLGSLEESVLEDAYGLTEDGREVAKLFTERSWELTDGELSYVVPKASTYNSNWEDFREFCLPKLYRGIDLGKAFGTVDHEQVTMHLSRAASGDAYQCGPLGGGDYRLDEVATVDRSVAERLGTIPVSFSAREQTVVAGLGEAEFPTVGDRDIDAGRGASTTARIDESGAPIAYNGKQIQRYFTRTPDARIDTDDLAATTRSRVESPKVMAQNIIAHRTNPYDHVRIAAAYDPIGTYTFETVTNVVVTDETAPSLPALSVLLNTRFVNWFVSASLFNRAIRDMHLDAYFLDHVVLPRELSRDEQRALEDLYGLLAISAVSAADDSLPDARQTYVELQSIANAVTYELYLRDVPEAPLQTAVAEHVSDVLGGYDVAFEDWYARHLRSTDDRRVRDRFRENEDLFATATDVVSSLRTDAIDAELRAVARHPWVDIMERGRHRRADRARPLFGPVDDV